ncbi:MAG: 2-amino-4-hydroxy-6-hydroxymethyldihydropteridine diphosphokinase, partial [Kangiellaceae bacterium]|nr:2-amino-4-hydroxy-6-hydroxymethyldihydropteridine diphosphokinase [Kangiellaceae bacterium]
MAEVFLSIGSNIDRKKHIRFALEQLYKAFGPLQTSSVYLSQSIGFDGDDFYNMVVRVSTSLSVSEIVTLLKSIEKASGRDFTTAKFSARTLDIDLLNYDQQVTNEPIILPREEILYNAFVLLPFYQLAPQWYHPIANKTISELWQA